MTSRNGVPQLEDGYSRVANEILEAIARTSLSDYESRCIHLLWRKTYGWGLNGTSKKSDRISLSQWAEGTSIDRRNVHRTLEKLVSRHIITRNDVTNGKLKVVEYGFQKRYNHWLMPDLSLPESSVSTDTTLKGQGSVSGDDTLGTGSVSGDDTLGTGSVSGDDRGSVSGDDRSSVSGDTHKRYIKDTIKIISGGNPFLEILEKLPGWGKVDNDDLSWIEELLKDFPAAAPGDFKNCRDYHSGRPPPKNKGPWKNRLRNWMIQDQKIQARRATSGTYSSNNRRSARAIPKTAESYTRPEDRGL